MSTKTTNYELIKPSLTDAADITATNANWDKIDAELSKTGKVVMASSTDGVEYVATVTGITELYVGLELTIIPDKTSTSTDVTLNVNNLGAKNIKQPLSFNTTATTTPKLDSFFVINTPIKLCYDGARWRTAIQKTSAQDLYGTVPIESGGTGATTAKEARDALGITAMFSYSDGVLTITTT